MNVYRIQSCGYVYYVAANSEYSAMRHVKHSLRRLGYTLPVERPEARLEGSSPYVSEVQTLLVINAS